MQLRRLLSLFFLCLFCTFTLSAHPKLPVDVSILIADLKYSAAEGVKICEVQQGVLSIFRGQQVGLPHTSGNRILPGQDGKIISNIYQFLTQFPGPYFLTLTNESQWGRTATQHHPEWRLFTNLLTLEKDPEFVARGTLMPKDPHNLFDYSGILLCNQQHISNCAAFHSHYPGFILVDEASRKYWADKYKMSCLFSKNETLSHFKPKWKAYPKEYHKKLANQIIQEIGGDRFVIKPIGAFLGDGVIIVDAQHLNETLKYILNKSNKLKKDKDHSYNHWFHDQERVFIVEKFASSDPISVPHLGGKLYEPTIRVAFILYYTNQTIHLEFCGAFYRLPKLSITEPGTLNEKYKDCSDKSYFAEIDPEVREKVQNELRVALPLLYDQMLEDTH